tara:strand:- start:966 stop:2249 length:1284 start_codon:yes stop_codon:yes gene_type:complete
MSQRPGSPMDYDDLFDRMPRPMPRRNMPRPMPRRDMPDMPRRGGGDKIDLTDLLDRLRGRSPEPRGPIGRTPDMPTRPSPKSKTIEDIFKGRSGRRTRPPESKRSPQEMMDMLREKLRGRGTGPRRDDLGSPTSDKYEPFDISKIDPSKLMSPFDQSRLQDARRNYEDVVARGGGGINPDGMFDQVGPSMPRMPGKVMRMNEGGEAMSPLEMLYSQIGVADEGAARDVIDKILSGESDQLTEDQRGMLGGGIYRRVANRLGMLDRAGNPISAGSSVATDYGKTETPTIERALQTLSQMEGAESGSGIESLLKQILGYDPNQETSGGAYRQAIEASGFPGYMSGGGGGQPMPEQPNKGYGGYGGQETSYGGNYGNPEYKGYFGEAPAMPYAGMSSPNPSLSNIIGMAPANYFGMADVVGKEDEGGTAS